MADNAVRRGSVSSLENSVFGVNRHFRPGKLVTKVSSMLHPYDLSVFLKFFMTILYLMALGMLKARHNGEKSGIAVYANFAL